MASLQGLRVSVPKATPIEDHSTYRYHIVLQYGETKWEVAKRFSEFDTLLAGLTASNYAGLPKLPSKTLLGSPTDTVAIDGRKEQLRIIINDLLFRPDTRGSHQLRQFLAMDSHMDAAVRSMLPEALRTFEDPRFGVSGLAAVPRQSLLFATHEDSTHLSRLGRVWSVVEPDELGALHLWGLSGESSWKRMYSRTYGIKVRSLCWEESSRQCFVGLEDGKIEVYALPTETLQPAVKATLELHHKSPVTHLACSPRRLLSLGFDTAMRVIDVRRHELVCGGRLAKRLKGEMDYLTTGYLDDDQDRAFIGTSGGDMFILDISQNPPGFQHTIELSQKPVTAMCLMKESFLVAHGELVTALSYERKTMERRTSRLGSYRSKHLCADEVAVLSLEAAPSRQLIFGAFSDGAVAIWSVREAEAFVVFRAHQGETSKLVWVDRGPWGPCLLTGGGDGKVITWTLAISEEDLCFWRPQQVDAEEFLAPLEATGLAEGTEDFTHGGTTDLFRTDNPRVNPKALKQSGESDSEDDDIVGAFH